METNIQPVELFQNDSESTEENHLFCCFTIQGSKLCLGYTSESNPIYIQPEYPENAAQSVEAVTSQKTKGNSSKRKIRKGQIAMAWSDKRLHHYLSSYYGSANAKEEEEEEEKKQENNDNETEEKNNEFSKNKICSLLQNLMAHAEHEAPFYDNKMEPLRLLIYNQINNSIYNNNNKNNKNNNNNQDFWIKGDKLFDLAKYYQIINNEDQPEFQEEKQIKNQNTSSNENSIIGAFQRSIHVLAFFLALEKSEEFERKRTLFRALSEDEAEEKRWESRLKIWYQENMEHYSPSHNTQNNNTQNNENEKTQESYVSPETPLDRKSLSPKEKQQLIPMIHDIIRYDLSHESCQSENYRHLHTIAHAFRLPRHGTREFNRTMRHILDHLGASISWPDFYLLKAHIKPPYASNADEMVQNKLYSMPPLPDRKPDRKPITCITIDSENTQDFDDALTIFDGYDENSIYVMVSIANVTRLIHENDELFNEAKERVSTVYMPHQIIHMLPASISEEHCSLRSGEERSVLNFVFKLFTDGCFETLDIFTGSILVEQNLSYKKVDEWIENESFTSEQPYWRILNKCCQSIQERRIGGYGALDFSHKEVEIDASDPEHVQVEISHRVDGHSSAQRIIQELSILANQETGRSFMLNKIPGLYRCQEIKHGRVGGLYLTTTPSSNQVVGADYYMQLTSPIRRFTDLVGQIQFVNYLEKNRITFEQEQLEQWIPHIMSLFQSMSSASREIRKYWKIVYLSQCDQNQLFHATITHDVENKGKVRVEIDCVLLGLDAVIPRPTSFKKGDAVQCRLTNIDLDILYVDVEVVL